MTADAGEAHAYAESLNVVHSGFFRDPLTWAVLETLVLPELADPRGSPRPGTLRTWSAGCATGEEVYSLAILLRDLADARGAPLRFRIFGTDRSDAALARAASATWAEPGLQNVRLGQVERHSVPAPGGRRIREEIRAVVDLSRHDLLDDAAVFPPSSIYGGFDLVLCCNVLIYYRSAVRAAILGRLRRSLSDRGVLVTGESERGIVEAAGGFRAALPLAPVWRKGPEGRGA